MESSGKGYAIYEQNYVALLQGSKMSAELRSRKLILGSQYFKVTTLNVHEVEHARSLVINF